MPETLVRAPLALDDAAADLLFREARTPNTFSSEPVADEQLRAAYDLIKWAPTAFNAQPLRVVLARRGALGPMSCSAWRACTSSTSPAIPTLAVDRVWWCWTSGPMLI